MNLFKKIGIIGLAAATFTSATAFCPAAVQAKADETKTIEMYLIGGQSNAAGMSKHMYAVNEEFNNIGYMGEVEHRSLAEGAEFSDQITSSDTIKRGLGHRNYEIGPEYGMAKAMNGYYGNGNRAFIFKYAVGGTPMLEMGRDSWLSRSLWESGYEPDITKQPSSSNGTGWLYSMFLNNFEYCYNHLKEEGYTPVVKGMAWMQGENDLGHHEEYAAALESFIGDIRNDLSEITKADLSGMPFVIGEIATTFQQYNNPAVPPFIEAQRAVAQKLNKVATIATNDLIIVNEYGGINGSDNSHFNVNDEVTLGQRFGRKLMELNGKKSVEIEETGGVVTFDYSNPDSLVLTLTAEGNRTLTEFTVNGQDLLSAVQNGKYTVTSPEANTAVKAVFSNKTRFKVSYNKAEHGEFTSAPAFVYDGEVLKVKAKAAAGYEIVNVKYGETEMSYNEVEDCFETVAEKADTVSLTTQKVASSSKSAGEGLAGWAIALIVVGCVLVAGGVGLTIFLIGRKKSK